MKRILTAVALAVGMIVVTPIAAHAHHNGYKYSRPTLTSLTVVSCTSVKVTFKRTSPYTSANYGTRSDFRGSVNWHAWENGTRDEVRNDTSFVIPNLRPGKRNYFRVYASEYGGHRLSRYSNVRSIVLPSC